MTKIPFGNCLDYRFTPSKVVFYVDTKSGLRLFYLLITQVQQAPFALASDYTTFGIQGYPGRSNVTHAYNTFRESRPLYTPLALLHLGTNTTLYKVDSISSLLNCNWHHDYLLYLLYYFVEIS